MIAKSDLIILTLATSALMLGVVRWQYNIRPSEAITMPASVRLAPPATASSQQPLQSAARQPVARQPSTASASQNPARGQAAEPSSSMQTSAATPTPPPAKQSKAPDLGVHVVTSGEYLSLIAQKYDTTVKELAALNNIEGDTIYVGQEIRYPQTNW